MAITARKHIKGKLNDAVEVFGKNYSHIKPKDIKPPHTLFSLEFREPVLTKDTSLQYLETWLFDLYDISEEDVETLADNVAIIFDAYAGTNEDTKVYSILQEEEGDVTEEGSDQVYHIAATYLFRVTPT